MPQYDFSSTERKPVNLHNTTPSLVKLQNQFGVAFHFISLSSGLASLFLLLTVIQANLFGQEDKTAARTSAETNTQERLRKIVTHLSETIGERNLTKPNKVKETVAYLQKELESSGYKITKQTFQVNGIDCHNLIAEVIGEGKPDEIIVVGAHYDSAQGTPGANDNGSGVAALLEIAKQLHGKPYSRTVRYVAFANEEPPYFQRDGQMGSWVYAKACRERKDNLKVVLSLETMGYFTDEANSQKYPPLLAPLYPSTGNFIGLVSNLPSRKLLDDVAKHLKTHCKVDVQKGALPGDLQGVGWSDHWSFWQEGYEGLMVTDTALFRYPHYHAPEDTVDKLTFKPYAQVVDGLAKTVADLANPK